MRKVKVQVYFSAENKRKEVIGKFHQWGSTFEEFRESPSMQCTMAIVELEDGKIVEVSPSNVQFLD